MTDQVYFISRPEYPVAKGFSYNPKAYASNWKDVLLSSDQSDDMMILNAIIHPVFGPLILCRTRLQEVAERGGLGVCANTEYYGKGNDVSINELTLITSSCNPRSDITILNNNLLQAINYATYHEEFESKVRMKELSGMKPITESWIKKLVGNLTIPKISNEFVRKEVSKVEKNKNIPAHYAKVLHRHKMFIKEEPEPEETDTWTVTTTCTSTNGITLTFKEE